MRAANRSVGLFLVAATCFAQRPAWADDTPSTRAQASPQSAAPLRASEVDPGEIEGWPPSSPPPPGYRWGSKPRHALVQSGLALFVISYAPSFALATIDNSDLLQSTTPSAWLFVPVAGPFVLVGQATNSTAKALLVTDGVFQGAGVGLMTLGLAWQLPILVRAEKAARVRAGPALLGTGAGLRLEGAF